MESLSFDNIYGEAEIDNLFVEPEKATAEETEVEVSQEEKPADDQKTISDTDSTTEVVNPDDLFEDTQKQPESVGSGKDKEGEKEGTTTDEDGGTSPNENFYSSIAQACAVDGIFPNLDEETVKKVDSAEGLSDLIEAEVVARLDEKTKRVSQALENGVEATDIRKYENTLGYINSIKDADLAEESEKGEELRYRLIYQDFINRGYSQERADKLTKRSIDAGTDVEDAKEALLNNKEFFQNSYNNLLKEAQQKADEDKEDRKKRVAKMQDSILKDKTRLGDMEISADLRKKAFEAISKPVYKDPETGEYLTALQKYQMEHSEEFLKYAGLFMTLTNGFKDFDSFTKGKVKKEVRKGMRELEHTLNGTKRNADGSLKMVTSVKDDPESFLGSDFKLAL